MRAEDLLWQLGGWEGRWEKQFVLSTPPVQHLSAGFSGQRFLYPTVVAAFRTGPCPIENWCRTVGEGNGELHQQALCTRAMEMLSHMLRSQKDELGTGLEVATWAGNGEERGL